MHPRQGVAQNHIECRRTGAADAHAGGPAQGNGHRGGQAEDLDVGLGDGLDGDGAVRTQADAVQGGQHHAVDDVARQRNTHRQGCARAAAQSSGQRGSARNRANRRAVAGLHQHLVGLDVAGPIAQGRQGGDARMHAGADLVFCPDARAAGGQTRAPAASQRRRARNHQGVDDLATIGAQVEHTTGFDVRIDDQGPHGGDRIVAHHAKALLADQVARHGNANGRTQPGARADTDGHRQSRNGGADGLVARCIEHHIAFCGGGRAAAEQGVGRAADGVDRHGPRTAEGQTRTATADADGRRSRHRHRIDAVARDHRGRSRRRSAGCLIESQGVALAGRIDQLPALAFLDHRHRDFDRRQLPAALVGIVFVGHEQHVVHADVAVDAVFLATAFVALCHPHRVALVHAVGIDLDLFPAIGIAEVLGFQVDLQLGQGLVGCGVGALGQFSLIELEIIKR